MPPSPAATPFMETTGVAYSDYHDQSDTRGDDVSLASRARHHYHGLLRWPPFGRLLPHPTLLQMGRDGGDPIGLDEKGWRLPERQTPTGSCHSTLPVKAIVAVSLVVEDDVDQSVDIGDVHLVVAVHIGSSRGLVLQDQSDEGVDVGDVHLAVTVHVTLQLCFDFNPR